MKKKKKKKKKKKRVGASNSKVFFRLELDAKSQLL